MKKLLCALGLLAALLFAAPSAHATDCVIGTPYTPTGTYETCTVPAGVTSLIVSAWGPGGAGGDSADSGVSGGGGGGGFCQTTISVTPGATIYFQAGSAGQGDVGSGPTYGTDSWVNKSTYSEPISGVNGCYATYGKYAASTYGQGYLGAINYAGGTSINSSIGGGGGGAGGGGPGSTAGVQPSPGAGGPSGHGVGGGGSGSAGQLSGNSAAGGSPGGGSGGTNSSGGYTGNGGNGQIEFQTPPSSTPFLFSPSVIP